MFVKFIHPAYSTFQVSGNIGRASKILLFTLTLILSFAISSQAYDFSELRSEIIKNSDDQALDKSGYKLAIVYDNKHRKSLVKKVDLIRFKKELSLEMTRSFSVIDPIIVADVVNINKIKPQDFKDNKALIKQFCDRTESDGVLFLEMKPDGAKVNLSAALINRVGELISISNKLIEDKATVEKEKTQPIIKDEQESVPYSVFNDYIAPQFNETQNDAWMYFSPTALLIPEENALELALWAKNLSKSDIRLKNLRYDRRWKKVQFGAQLNGSSERNELHSAYGMIKYNAIDETIFPFNFSIGIRSRFFWNSNNSDFDSDNKNKDKREDIEDENDEKNKLTVLGALTGEIDSLGLMYTGYLDNQMATLGAKFLLTSEIKFFAEELYNYYTDAPTKYDTAVGIQVYSIVGTEISLSYQKETDQVNLGFVFDW